MNLNVLAFPLNNLLAVMAELIIEEAIGYLEI
jgi:hypothetical protein